MKILHYLGFTILTIAIGAATIVLSPIIALGLLAIEVANDE